MKKIVFYFVSPFSMLLFSACEGVKDDARDTPIGSVISGDSRDADDYAERVRERNRAAGRDVWRPENTDNAGGY